MIRWRNRRWECWAVLLVLILGTPAFCQSLSVTVHEPVEAAASEPAPARKLPKARAHSKEIRPPSGDHRAAATVVGALAAVLAIFFAVAWVTRRAAPGGMAQLPNEVVESLGRAHLASRQQLQLIRLGGRLLLLNITPHGARTLAEVTDAAEVERLAGLCQQSRRGSASRSFQQILGQVSGETPSPGFLERPAGRISVHRGLS